MNTTVQSKQTMYLLIAVVFAVALFSYAPSAFAGNFENECDTNQHDQDHDWDNEQNHDWDHEWDHDWDNNQDHEWDHDWNNWEEEDEDCDEWQWECDEDCDEEPTPTPTSTPTSTPTPTPTPQPKNGEKPGIDVEKSDDRDITRPGHILTYVITIKNTGNADLHDIEVTDTPPSYLTVTEISNSGVKSGSTITWSGIRLGEGETTKVSFSAKVSDKAPNGYDLRNTARACSGDHGVCDNDGDSTTVEHAGKVASKVKAQPPVKHVPVTAKTGMSGTLALVTTLLGGGSLAAILRKVL